MNGFYMLACVVCLVCVVSATVPMTTGYGYQSYTPVLMGTTTGSGFGLGGGSGFGHGGGMGVGNGLFDLIFFLFFFMLIINLLGFNGSGKSSGLSLGNLGGNRLGDAY